MQTRLTCMHLHGSSARWRSISWHEYAKSLDEDVSDRVEFRYDLDKTSVPQDLMGDVK